jgi:hypothetical protein
MAWERNGGGAGALGVLTAVLGMDILDVVDVSHGVLDRIEAEDVGENRS